MKLTKHQIVQIPNLLQGTNKWTTKDAKLRLEMAIPAKTGLVTALTRKAGKTRMHLTRKRWDSATTTTAVTLKNSTQFGATPPIPKRSGIIAIL